LLRPEAIIMGRKHHAAPAESIARPLATRIFAVLTLALPAVFYLLSMSFALKTIYDPAYAESLVYDDVPEVATYPNSSTPYTQKASPFFSWYVCISLPEATFPKTDGVRRP
jgi:hypothetical protein